MTEKLQATLEVEGLSSLLDKFNEQGVTDSILGDLTDSDLKELGVDKLGERKRLLAAFGKSGGDAVAVSVVEESSAQTSGSAPSKTAATPAEATKDSPWVNTLGMPFVPIPRFETRFCIWPVRVQDYEAYCVASGAKFPEIPFPQDSDHPIVGVSWNDAIEFCVWLTGKERSEGKIDEKTVYRLPTDLEWSAAVGLPHEPEATPAERHLKAAGYPWGLRWPPPKNAGNYEDGRKDQLCFGQLEQKWSAERDFHSERFQLLGSGPQYEKQFNCYGSLHAMSEAEAMETAAIYSNLSKEWKSDWSPVDEYEFTCSVGTFSVNPYGVYDLGGNVWEWCMDTWLASQSGEKVLRGGSFASSFRRLQSFAVTDPSCSDWTKTVMKNFVIEVPISNKDLYRASYRHYSEGNECCSVLVHSGTPTIDDQVDESGWSQMPNSGFRLVVAC